MKKKIVRFTAVVGITLTLIGVVVVLSWNLWIKKAYATGRVDLKLEEELRCDKALSEMQRQLKEEEIQTVFWKQEEAILVTNPKFNCSEKTKVMAITGDSSILFPRSNVLQAGERGYCLLGKELARKLFGSTRIVGETIEIAGESYQVAGIQYQVEDLCVYEGKEDDKVDQVSFYSEDSFDRGITKQKLSNLLLQE